jgi:hypothetical protein
MGTIKKVEEIQIQFKYTWKLYHVQDIMPGIEGI